MVNNYHRIYMSGFLSVKVSGATLEFWDMLGKQMQISQKLIFSRRREVLKVSFYY